MSGAREEAQKRLEQLLRLSLQVYVPAIDIARVYVGLGQKEHALEWLQKAYDEHSDQITYIGVDPSFDPLRKEPRFQLLSQNLSLSQIPGKD